MRKSIQKLLDNSECILSTGHSFLFVKDFERKKYTEKYEESCLEGSSNLSVNDIVLDEEWNEIHDLIENGNVIWGYDSSLDSKDKDWCKIMNAIIKKRAQEKEIKCRNHQYRLSPEP